MRYIVGAAAAALAVAVIGGSSGAAGAADLPPLKVGVIMTYSGPYATYGHQADLGINTFFKAFGDTIGGRKVEIIRKDDTGLAPDVSKRMTQELVTRDHADIILGGCWSPNALASAPVVSESHTPFFVIVAATSGIPAKSPYMVRVGLSVTQPSYSMGVWATQNGLMKGYAAVADYVLGASAEEGFKKGMEKGGGAVIGDVKIPTSIPEMTPYVQRIMDARPDIIFLSLPAGDQAVAFVKAYHDMGLWNAGIKLASGDITETGQTDQLGDFVQNIYNATNYIEANDTPANKQFLAAFHAVTTPDTYAGFVALEVYDALSATKKVVEEQDGKVDPDKTMGLLRGHKFASPRGEIEFDAKTGDIIDNWYLRRADLVNGKIVMTPIQTIPMIRDPLIN